MLTAEIAHVARVSSGVSGRLDPPLTLELDEIGNTAPVPVAAWATWAAGSGICIKIYAQSYSQLVTRWKEQGAETIWQSSDVKVIYAHTTEDGLCRRVEQACGQVRIRQPGSTGGPSGRTYSWAAEQVLSAAQVRELPSGTAIVIQGGARPVIVRTERYWQRPDVRAFLRRGGKADLPAAPLPKIPIPDPALLEASAETEGALEQQLEGLDALEGLAGGQPPYGVNFAWPEDELAVRRARRQGTTAGTNAWPEEVSGAPWPEPHLPNPGEGLPPGTPGWVVPAWPPGWDDDVDAD
jgi:hypothetical protein